MINKLTLASIFLMVAFNLFAQFDARFGKVSKEELELKECSFDSDANSMILSQTGYLRFIYNDSKSRWQYRIDITKRIKVFNKLDKDVANISIVLYDPENSSDDESVSSLKGFTYNLVQGKIEKSKLTNAEEYRTRISDYRTEVSFAMPDVNDGSVLEYKYTITSDYISNLYTWHFQSYLPIYYSEFETIIPEWFNYSSNQVGTYIPLEIKESKMDESFTYSWESQGALGQTRKGTSSLNSISTKVSHIARNTPKIENEPFMNNKPDIPARLEYQLMSYQMPGSTLKKIAGNYDEYTKNIMGWDSFGHVLNKGGFSKDIIASFYSSGDSLAHSIYSHVQNHFTWNDVYGFTSSDAGRKAYNDATGNVGAINLTLIAILREAGIEAHPVILSTRGHGVPHPIYPNTEDFNYVIASVQLSDKVVLLDATSDYPFGTLPVRCLNGNGWMATENGGKWVDLKQGAEHGISTMISITIEDDELIKNHQMKFTGHAALDEIEDYDEENESKYIEAFETYFTDSEVDEFKYESDIDQVVVAFNATKDTDMEDIMYIQPMNIGLIQSNPFKREVRQSLVDFSYPISRSVIVQINIPEGYTAELPESTIIALPNNGGRFTYSVNQVGNKISLLSRYNLNQTMFTTQEYPALKQFYDLMVKKNTEMIVLKPVGP